MDYMNPHVTTGSVKISNELDNYSDRLVFAMSFRSMTQSNLARLIGYPPQTIQRICANKKTKGSIHTASIAKALNISIDWLAEGLGNITSQVDSIKTNRIDEVNESPLILNLIKITGRITMCEKDSFVVNYTAVDNASDGAIAPYSTPTMQLIEIVGSELQPALHDGWILAVDPAEQPQAGEYVVLHMRDGSSLIGSYLYQRGTSININSLVTLKPKTLNLADVQQILPICSIVMARQKRKL